MAQRLLNMHLSYITEPLSAALRTLFATLVLLVFPMGVWGQTEWTEVSTVEALQNIFTNGGNAILGADITKENYAFEVAAGKTVQLDLAGHTLKISHEILFYSSVITIPSGGTLTIEDSSGGNAGKITGGKYPSGKGAGISNSGTLTINGGTITGNDAPQDGGYSGYGGAIHNAQNATLTINGGVITDNQAHNAGGIYNEGNMYLRGGRIYSNNNNTANSLSSGIYNTLTATLTISGSPIVENNGYGDIFLQNGMKITIDGELTGEEGRICIMMANYSQGAFTTGLKTGANYTNPEGFKYFKSDNNNYEPYFDETETTEASFYTNWVALGKRFAAGGNIKLNKNYTAASTDTYLEVPAGKEVTLDLNGKDINRHLTSATPDGCVIKNQGNLTIKDTGITGTIMGGRNSGDGGGIVNNGILNIEGGEIYNNRATGNGAGIYHNGTSLNIKGRVRIHGNTGSYNDNNVYLSSGKTITINGQLDNNTRIGVTMADYRRANTNTGVFTSGLGAYGNISNFTSDQNLQYINVYSDGNGEAKLQTDWSYLQDAMQVNNNVITLDKDYRYGETDAGGLNVPGSKTVTLNLNGHTIDRHLSSDITDGYVIKVDGTLTISGTGTITGGRNIGDGGGILNNGTLNIEGGTITGNRATGNGGGIYHSGTTLTLSGAPVITGNTNTVNSSNNNIYLPSGNLITIGGSLTGADRNIGISMQTPGTFTSGLNNSTLHVKFSSDDANYDTRAYNNEAQLLSAWNALKERLYDGESTIVLDKNYTAAPGDGALVVPNGRTVTLNLNGHTIDRNRSTAEVNGFVLQNDGTLTITDSGIGGTITGGKNTQYGGGINNGGTLTIQGGSITENTSSYFGGGIYNKGRLTINGGTISYNNASYGGGGIYNSEYGTSPEISISGGRILNNSANNGGGIYHGTGTLSISGGTIQGNIATSQGAGIYYDSGTFNLSGNPTVTGNTVSSVANNIYLPNGKKITVNGPLTGTNGSIGITMANPTIFTSGLTTNSPASSSYEKFFPDASTTIKLLEFGGEAQLKGYWYYLLDLFIYASTDSSNPTVITLESGKVYKPLSDENALSVPPDTYITLNLNGQTIDRGLGSSEAQDNGCVIHNEGNLRITGSGTITGGNNNDTGTFRGGGIYNEGVLTIEGASSVQNNHSTLGGGVYNAGTLYINGGTVQENSTSLDGGGIYQASGTLYINGGTIQSNTAAIGRNGAGIFYDGGTFNLAGNPTISSNTVNSVANNVYLKGDNNITITNILSNTTAIGIVCENGHTDRAFTSGLSGKGNAEKFTSNVTGREIGVNSLGEAIIGIPYTLSFEKNDASIYVNGNKYDNSTLSVVAGGHLKVQVQAPSGYIPISFTHTDGDLSSYPKSNVEYPFDMPGHNVTITATCKRGGYCGNPSENMKYYLDGTTLRFVSYDGSSQPMATYSSNNVPWRNYATYNFSAVDLSMVSSISPYAFFGSNIGYNQANVNIPGNVTSIGTFAFGKCQSLTNLTVASENPNYSASGNVLYSKSAQTLICYPAGKTENSYELPSTVTSVSDGAFAYETNLQTITVAGGNADFTAPDGVLYKKSGDIATAELVHYPADKEGTTYLIPTTATKIDPYAFHYNNNLERVYLHHTSVPTGGTSMFNNTSCYIMVKDGLEDSYKGTANWISYSSLIKAIRLSDAEITLNYPILEWYNCYYVDFDDAHSDMARTPNVTNVISNAGDGYTLVKDVDYTVSYTNNVNIGLATVNITGINNYAGVSGAQTFNITRNLTYSGTTGNYVTYHNNDNVNYAMPVTNNMGLTTYLVTGVNFTNGTVTLSPAMNWIPANMPVILYHAGGCNREHHMIARTAGTESLEYDNTHFKGVGTGPKDLGTLKSDNGGVKAEIYALRNEQFYRAYQGTLAARRCYIVKPASEVTSAPSFLSMITGDGNATSIEVPIEEIFGEEKGDWYTLDGRKLQGRPTQRGVYIRNGKKIAIK